MYVPQRNPIIYSFFIEESSKAARGKQMSTLDTFHRFFCGTVWPRLLPPITQRFARVGQHVSDSRDMGILYYIHTYIICTRMHIKHAKLR